MTFTKLQWHDADVSRDGGRIRTSFTSVCAVVVAKLAIGTEQNQGVCDGSVEGERDKEFFLRGGG